MQQYTSTYRGDTNQGLGTGTDEWYDGNGLTVEQGGNIEDLSGCGLTSNEYTELKQKMLKSVYEDAGFYIMNVKAQYSIDDGMNYKKILTEGYSKPTESVLLTTGATKRNSVLGIYDLAGNVYERTLERTSDVDNPCSLVGGCYFSDGTNVSASYRGYGKIYYSYNYTGFRTVLY